jgi:hypothetical protein
MKPDDFPLPSCQEETKECQDCGLWEYKDDRDPPEALLLH